VAKKSPARSLRRPIRYSFAILKLFQPVRILSVNIAMSAIFGHRPLCKLQRNNSPSIDHLSEEGPLAFFSIRDEPFITQICRRSQESCSNLVGDRTALVESGPTHTIDANSPARRKRHNNSISSGAPGYSATERSADEPRLTRAMVSECLIHLPRVIVVFTQD
jgi:hypothetical protein